MSKDMKMPTFELPGAGKHSSGNMEARGYKIEVRSSYYSPTVIGELIIDSAWRQLPIVQGATPFGVNIPVGWLHQEMMRDAGLLRYEAAEAHRWAFLAWLEAHHPTGSLCIETRLVEVQYRRQWSTEEIGVTPAVTRIHEASGVVPRSALTGRSTQTDQAE